MEMYGLSDIKNSIGMHIAHLNIHSPTNKWDTFKTQFEIRIIHVLALSGIWLNDSLPSDSYNLSADYILI